jgi:formylglycine-generating enzyme required for sulfatase activity
LTAACALGCAPLLYGDETRPGALEDVPRAVDRGDPVPVVVDDVLFLDRVDASADVDLPAAPDVVTAADRPDGALPDVPRSDAGSSQRFCAPGVPGCGLVEVAAATVTLGDPEAQSASPLQPDQRVNAFAIDRYEVTVARFRRYWASPGPSAPTTLVDYPGQRRFAVVENVVEPTSRAAMSGCNWSRAPADREDHPINCVSWVTAMSFCVWDGGRLPTEAEWELAARGTEGRPWPWGSTDDPARVCDGRLPGRAGTCAVDDPAFLAGATPEGVAQMVGNVWEWCADRYGPFALGGTGCWQGVARTNPVCAVVVGDIRTLRGGAWINSQTRLLRAASRAAQAPGAPEPGLGFRCARTR